MSKWRDVLEAIQKGLADSASVYGYNAGWWPREEGQSIAQAVNTELADQWHYGPTESDPDPAKKWHYGCGGEVWTIDGVEICTRCGREWFDTACLRCGGDHDWCSQVQSDEF